MSTKSEAVGLRGRSRPWLLPFLVFIVVLTLWAVAAPASAENDPQTNCPEGSAGNSPSCVDPPTEPELPAKQAQITRLTAAVAKVKAGRTAKLTLKLVNKGDVAAKDVKVTLRSSSTQVKLPASVVIKRVAAGSATKLTVGAKTTLKAKGTIQLTAKAAKLVARANLVVTPLPKYVRVLRLARRELAQGVRERRGDNVPRYRYGRGPIAPYSIKDAWCVAFGTWIWNKAGFLDYLGTGIVWSSYDRTRVAVQVADISRWAKRTGHWSAKAEPGFLIAYGAAHAGIVEQANRKGQAVQAIEGNKDDAVRRVRVPMAKVTGYISPERLTARRIRRSLANPDMIVPAGIAADPEAIVRNGSR